ncbi:dihydropteroate synthase, partial [Bacillus safensis]|uniref:dihydropteroate synthase n=1 Tax=Bacillus safensis TaxID=561879 RepID=UPI003703F971
MLNLTPHSFSHPPKFNQLHKPLPHPPHLIEHAPHIIHIPPESTPPPPALLSQEQHLSTLIPLIHNITKQLHLPISIHTYKPRLAHQPV